MADLSSEKQLAVFYGVMFYSFKQTSDVNTEHTAEKSECSSLSELRNVTAREEVGRDSRLHFGTQGLPPRIPSELII
jgi:hypothetical protein